MLLFIDESGHDGHNMPCEVLAGVAISEDNLWNLVQAIRSAEREHFGGYLRELHADEIKGRTLLKIKRFKSAARNIQISADELVGLANSCLRKGLEAGKQGLPQSEATQREIVAYSRQVLKFTHRVIDLAASFSVQIFASVVDLSALDRPGLLRKDYVYLFERYFYFLETLSIRERGLIVFDELDKSQSHILLQQMAAYFLGTETGRYRSSRIVPEPFFVHSDLTTGYFWPIWLHTPSVGDGGSVTCRNQSARNSCLTPQNCTTCSLWGRNQDTIQKAFGTFTASGTSTICEVSSTESRKKCK